MSAEQNTIKETIGWALSTDRQLKTLFVIMVVVGYIVTFAFIAIDDIRSVTNEEAILAIVIGIIYTILGVNDHLIYDRMLAPCDSPFQEF